MLRSFLSILFLLLAIGTQPQVEAREFMGAECKNEWGGSFRLQRIAKNQYELFHRFSAFSGAPLVARNEYRLTASLNCRHNFKAKKWIECVGSEQNLITIPEFGIIEIRKIESYFLISKPTGSVQNVFYKMQLKDGEVSPPLKFEVIDTRTGRASGELIFEATPIEFVASSQCKILTQ